MYDVFISFASEDVAFAQEVHEFLLKKGLRVFFSDVTLMQEGDSHFPIAIGEALDASTHLVVIASSPEAPKKGWVQHEWNFFITERNSGRKKGNILTILFGNMSIAELPPSLRQYEAIRWDAKGKTRLSGFFRPPVTEIFRIDTKLKRVYWGIRPTQHANLKKLPEEQRIDGDKRGPMVTVWKTMHTPDGLKACKLAKELIPKSEWVAREAGVDLKGIIIKANSGEVLYPTGE